MGKCNTINSVERN